METTGDDLMSKDGKWEKKFDILNEYQDPRALALKNEFYNCVFEECRIGDFDSLEKNHTILICVVKDDLRRIKQFVKHYRTLKINHFVFLDNDSTDGTREFLCKQDDCDVYLCNTTYSSANRVAWLNKLIDMYGDNRWYVMVDSDEFIYYPEMEFKGINDLIAKAKQIRATRISGYLIDMYPNGELFELTDDDFLKQIKFFDKDSYYIHNTYVGVSIKGGPRKRVLHVNNELAKCPIFTLNANEIVASAHYLLPRIKAKYNPLWMAIGHYKFLDDIDSKKVKEAVETEKYAGGSDDYKKYMKQFAIKGKTTFYDSNKSIEFIDGNSFSCLPYLCCPFEKGE